MERHLSTGSGFTSPDPKFKKRNSFKDPLDYYKAYSTKFNEVEKQENELIGECYIGLSKLLRTELRLFDRRDT